eukprot:2932134-Prymnesium_polylepis.1
MLSLALRPELVSLNVSKLTWLGVGSQLRRPQIFDVLACVGDALGCRGSDAWLRAPESEVGAGAARHTQGTAKVGSEGVAAAHAGACRAPAAVGASAEHAVAKHEERVERLNAFQCRDGRRHARAVDLRDVQIHHDNLVDLHAHVLT